MTHIARIDMQNGAPVVHVDGAITRDRVATYPIVVGPSRVASDAAAFVLNDEGWALTGWWTPAGTVTVTRKDTP